MGKVLLGMLMICIPGQVFGWDWQTKVTVSIHDQPLLAVCELLEQQYNIHFSYSRDIVNLSRRITLNVHDKPLKKLLEDLFSPYNIRFARIGEQIVLTVKKDAQYTVSGYVQDLRTGERLIGATIYSPAQQTGTITNQYGFFSLTLPKDTSSLQVTYIGYTPVRLPVTGISKKQVIVPLQPLNSLQEVVVSESYLNHQATQMQMSRLNVSMADVKSMPRLLGEADLMRTLAAQPGVSGGMDGGGSLNVRGGSPDQNLILLDGTPVFNASHLLGIFSVFNPDIVKNTDFYKGAFPARYGGRLSSIVDVSMKDGDMQHYHGEAAIGLIAAKFMVEGPIVKNKTSFLVSARRSYTDLLINELDINSDDDNNTGNSASVYFYDANVKINHIFSPENRIYFSGYIGDDHFSVKSEKSVAYSDGSDYYKENELTRMGWGNVAATLRWNHIFNPQLFANVTLNFSRYSFSTDFSYNYNSVRIADASHLYGKYYSKIRDGLAKLDFEYRPNPQHTVKFGMSGISHIFNPGVSILKNYYNERPPIDTAYNKKATWGAEVALYGEDDWDISSSLHLNAGLHISGFLIDKVWYNSIQPRLGVRYKLPHNWALKMSYTHMNQYLHLLTDGGTSLPTDLWVPSTSRVNPMFSRQVSLGVSKMSRNNMFAYSVETYYKTMDNVIEYKENAALFSTGNTNWDEQVVTGIGRSYGGEVLLEKKTGTTRGWIGYTLAWSDRQFKKVNKGKPFPYKYDRRHDVEIVIIQRLGKCWEMSASWEYTSGLPLTLPVASYEGINNPSPWDTPSNVPILDRVSNRNQFRGRNQHRLDLSATYTKKKKYWVKSWTFSLYNAYNQRNPQFYSIVTDRAKQERYLSEISLLPLLPSVTYSLKF
ncbi:TonB-dependent receptor [Chitinophaga sp. CF118]|uniref:TonB-dependent receptor n=1 Tax=Chitinophaga sp. CF118 TaxID=1884367 RepID=UPI0015A62B97|nr:TonB-dependent receptor [Chitinophaga sp. CF118]